MKPKCLVLLLMIGLNIGCVKDSQKTVPNFVYKPTRNKISKTLLISGKIDVKSKDAVSAPVDGTIRQILVEPGVMVKKGDPLFEYDLTATKTNVLAKKVEYDAKQTEISNDLIRLRAMESNAKKLKMFYNKKFIPLKELEDAQRELLIFQNSFKTRQKEFEGVQEKFEQISRISQDPIIKSPLTGIVSSIWHDNEMFSPGAAIRQGIRVVTISDSGNLVLAGKVLESEVSLVKEGQPVSVSIAAFSGKVFSGKIVKVAVSPEIDTATSLGTYPVKIELDKPDESVQPGMAASAELILNTSENALVIPVSAIYTDQGLEYVNTVTQNVVSKRQIKRGITNDFEAEILEGLTEADQVQIQVQSPNAH